jgi:hypothetical protein
MDFRWIARPPKRVAICSQVSFNSHCLAQVFRPSDPPREMVSNMRYQLLLLSGAAARMSAFHGVPTLLG